MRILLHSGKPIICTAHGPADLDRDIKYLTKLSSEEDFNDLGMN